MSQKITPCLWFDKECEEAINFYTATFNDSRIVSIERYPEGKQIGPMSGMEGKILTAIFELAGQRFMALDGGPIFKLNPAISFQVKCKSKDEVDELWEKLSKDGQVLMPLDKYPFSERYGWCNDKYGVSWQVIFVGENEIEQKITPFLMFVGDMAGKAEEAINYYISVFSQGSSKVNNILRYGAGEEPDKEGTVRYVDVTIFGQQFVAMDSAHEHKFQFNEATSFQVECESQQELDGYWDQLSAVPESEQCGWLKDKYGVSWQIIPKRLGELLADKDKVKAGRVMDAMLNMKKIVIADLEKAYEEGDSK